MKKFLTSLAIVTLVLACFIHPAEAQSRRNGMAIYNRLMKQQAEINKKFMEQQQKLNAAAAEREAARRKVLAEKKHAAQEKEKERRERIAEAQKEKAHAKKLAAAEKGTSEEPADNEEPAEAKEETSAAKDDAEPMATKPVKPGTKSKPAAGSKSSSKTVERVTKPALIQPNKDE